jgi:hypothetical protein
MMCKDNFVHYVKEITSQHVLAYSRHYANYAIEYVTNTKKDLDRLFELDIIILTYRDRHFEGLVNVRQGGQKVQARSSQTARQSQSASEHGGRPSFRDCRFLRSRRRCASQVRDASPRHRRQAVRHSVCYGIRLLTAYLLSSRRRLSARWPLRVSAREARASARSQAHAGRSGLRYATPGERSFAAPSGLGRCHPGTVRYKCSSAEYRTRTEAAGKKTSLNPAAGVRKTAAPQALISAYEDLRRQAAECSSSSGLGMAIILDQGMVAWMLACSWVHSTSPDNSRRCPTTAAPLPDELRGEIVLVLAAMALKQTSEVYP